MIFNEVIFVLSIVQLSLWRNRLARSAVNRKVGGSSPPGGETLFFPLGRQGLACAATAKGTARRPRQDSNLQSSDP